MAYNKGGVFRILLILSICCIMYYFGLENIQTCDVTVRALAELERNQEETGRGKLSLQQPSPARPVVVHQEVKPLPVIPEVPSHDDAQDMSRNTQVAVAPPPPSPHGNNLADLTQICDKESLKNQQSFDPTGVSRLFAVDKEHPIFYCPIQKVGSSFWLRTLTVMGSQNKYATPYEITLAQKNLKYFGALKKTMTQEEATRYLQEAFSFIFVRDPYSRLFSGYIDKVYYPNVVYWPSFTTEIVKAVRKKPSPQSLTFGHDVTFAEFIEYILILYEGGKQLDIHFSPMHELCNPCKVKYSFVGRFEDFQEDAEYLLDYFRSRFPDFTLKFEDFEEESIYDETIRHVRMLFATIDSTKDKLKYPIYKFIQRGWSNAQLRGHLSKSESLPFYPKGSNNLTVEDFMEKFDEASSRPANKTLVKFQRVEAMIQAYKTLPINLLERLHKFVQQDCLWFGYQDRPSTIYDRKGTPLPDHDYLVGL